MKKETKKRSDLSHIVKATAQLKEFLAECKKRKQETNPSKSILTPFMDFTIDGIKQERVYFHLFDEYVPITLLNFRILCSGDKVESLIIIICLTA
jgi:hypothetical protein